MSVRGVKVTTDKQVSVVELNELADYQACVDGNIEVVDMRHGSSLYLNEEGKIYHLPFNSIATDAVLFRIGLRDVIVGDVVITGPVDDEGETTSFDFDGPDARFLRKIVREAGGRWPEEARA